MEPRTNAHNRRSNSVVFKPADLGVDVTPHIKTLKVKEPPTRSAGIKVADVAALVDKLKNEAKVI